MFRSRIAVLSRRFGTLNILGIETSCDDTAVAIVNSEKKILAGERFTNRSVQKTMGGINPSVCAQQHKETLPLLIDKCLKTSGISPDKLDAVAVTVTPGLVIALKEGISAAIEFAKKYNLPLIPVHHMRAHALSILLTRNDIQFPFHTFLLSGGHAIISVANSADDFVLFGTSVSGSPGECIDKVAREIEMGEQFNNIHPGAAVELLAASASSDGHLRYSSVLPCTSGADMNFSQLKSTYLNIARKVRTESDFSVPDFCASLQHSVASHIVSKLHTYFDWISTEDTGIISNQLVVGGGVASNNYILNAIRKVASSYNIETFQVPAHLCTDNAEMIAYTGHLLLQNRSQSIIPANVIPESIYAHARTEIGSDERFRVSQKPKKRLAVSTIYGDLPIRFHENYKK